jgi:hypothetical protein
MPTYAYTVMQDLYAFKDLYREDGKNIGAMTFDDLADYADNVSKQLNNRVTRTPEEYKAEFIARMAERIAVECNFDGNHPETVEALADAQEYLDSL